MKLREIAHSRTGDKGDISTISLIVYDEKDYLKIKEKVTIELVKDKFKGIVNGKIDRYEIDSLCALNFVMGNALNGGVNSSLALDTHGKSYSSLLLDIEI